MAEGFVRGAALGNAKSGGVGRHKVIFALFSLVVLGVTWAGVGPMRSRKTLILAHNLDTQHPVHRGMQAFAAKVLSESNGRISIQLYPNGQLGSEREVLEQLQIGAVSLTKVSSLSLESFSPLFGVINAPYIFANEEHAYAVLDGEVGERLLESPLKKTPPRTDLLRRWSPQLLRKPTDPETRGPEWNEDESHGESDGHQNDEPPGWVAGSDAVRRDLHGPTPAGPSDGRTPCLS